MRDTTPAIFCLIFRKQSNDGDGGETVREPFETASRVDGVPKSLSVSKMTHAKVIIVGLASHNRWCRPHLMRKSSSLVLASRKGTN